MQVVATQDMIESLAARIERAYRLHRHGWNRGCSTDRVWAAAAARLLAAHEAGPALPLDAELYVSAQTRRADFADPWRELTQPASVRRYRSRIKRIIRALEVELTGEIRRAERLVNRGFAIEDVLLEANRSLSPLGRYISARRLGRDDLAQRLIWGARQQHRACPLYRQASFLLIAPELYPDDRVSDTLVTYSPPRIDSLAASCN